jgi:succinate dehydrogenase/fumarate reductase flavoprotein subunit
MHDSGSRLPHLLDEEDSKVPDSNRRRFLKAVGQGTLAAGAGLGLPSSARPDANDPEGPKKGDSAWPYPIAYDKETEVDVDVVVLGGGVSGCWAAIGAARKGLKVALVEKGNPKRSGSNGSGVDHWQDCAANPASRVSPDELAQDIIDARKGYICGPSRWIKTHEGWDRLQELEQMGMKIRDDEDEFKGAEFRDETTKLLFAFNYQDRTVIRIWGTGLKPALTRECRRLGVKIFDRVMATSLLSENGRTGSRIVGATGVNTRTGEFLVFKAKATILTAASPSRVWQFVDNLGISAHRPPNNSGDGFAMAWKAGAMFTLMEASSLGTQPGVGQGGAGGSSTWYPLSRVDSNGKEIPWFDVNGNVLSTVSQRCYPAPGQKRFLGGGRVGASREYRGPAPLSDRQIDEEVKKGNFVLPLYGDLSSMPEFERKAIFRLMVAQEGLGWIAYRTLTKAGFDPNKDLPQIYRFHSAPDVRSLPIGMGGLVVDWDMRTNLEGLYAAGEQAYGTWGCAGSSTTGHWAGQTAGDYALRTMKAPVTRQQIENEKRRVYAPVRQTSGTLWKELENGIAKVMQDYCGDVKHEESLKIADKWLTEIDDSELKKLRARTPHELMHALEASNILAVSQLVVSSCRARKASSDLLEFRRSDYPVVDPPEWHKFVTVKLEQGQVNVGELPINYGAPLAQNYAKHS